MNNEKGMTLIELLAVIVIIAIIAAIAIPAISNIIENSRVGAAKSDALSAFSAAELYLAENGDAFTATGQDGITGAELVTGGYLDDLGSFEATGGANTLTGFTINTDGDLLISGTATISGVQLVFAEATQDQVSEMPNGTGDEAPGEDFPAAGTATITVTR
ncbi:prepilin-type N-terminal cleavage/methylation domain-containing protein [Planococcus sp. ISL-110]|nr:prepilin-type N-terminal cleavage/methylation domain-containing protein [Planococcus sp. ISL-110]